MPDQRYEPHHKICNLRYGTHGYGMSACKIQSVHLLKLKFHELSLALNLLTQII